MNNFIELHDLKGNPVMINTYHITSVMHSATGDNILVCSDASIDDYIIVSESYEEVKQLIVMSGLIKSQEESGRIHFNLIRENDEH